MYTYSSRINVSKSQTKKLAEEPLQVHRIALVLLHVSDKAMTLCAPRGPINVLYHVNAACLLGLPGQPMEANSWPPKMLQNGHCAITKHVSN